MSNADQAMATYEELLGDAGRLEELGRAARERALDEHVPPSRTAAARAARHRVAGACPGHVSDPDPRLAALRLAIVRLQRGGGSVARVIDEIRAFDPGFEVVVVDDGSGDRTTEVAEEKGARATLPYNLGIGGSVQTAFRYALENDFELAVRLDGGRPARPHTSALIAPVLDGEADVAVGSRYLADGGYKQSAHRNIGNRILAGRRRSWQRDASCRSIVRVPGAQPGRDRALCKGLPARVSRGGGDGARCEAPAAPG